MLDHRAWDALTARALFFLAEFQPWSGPWSRLLEEIKDELPEEDRESNDQFYFDNFADLQRSVVRTCVFLSNGDDYYKIYVTYLDANFIKFGKGQYPSPIDLMMNDEDRQHYESRGGALSQIFDNVIAGNRTVQALVKRCHGSEFYHEMDDEGLELKCISQAILSRRFRSDCSLWPANLENYDLLSEWCGLPYAEYSKRLDGGAFRRVGAFDQQTVSDRKSLRLARHASDFISKRYRALIHTLRMGQLVAYGHAAGGQAVVEISPAEWHAPGLRIDFNEGQIGRAGAPRAVDTMSSVWTGVFVKLLAKAEVAVEQSTKEPNKIKDPGGRPEEFLWVEAFELLIVMLGSQGFPGSGKKSDLARMMLNCFESIKGAKVPSEGSVKDWLRERHPRVWNAIKEKPKGSAEK